MVIIYIYKMWNLCEACHLHILEICCFGHMGLYIMMMKSKILLFCWALLILCYEEWKMEKTYKFIYRYKKYGM
jgi:hypothetical protein